MDPRTRRDGVIYLVLGVGGMAAAVWTATLFHLPVAGTIVTLLPSLAGLYLSWAAFRAGRVAAEEPHGLGDVADLLAAMVRGQWESEVRMHRLNDPYPLPVAWQGADDELGESWDLLREMAGQWPAGPQCDPDRWATDQADLAGAGAEVVDMFLDRLPTRRLLVLGAPGTGKSMLLVRLLLSLIERRQLGGPVPVLFPLSSWHPAQQSLEDWMAQRLARDYTGLGDAQSGPAGHSGPARNLLARGLILPILDGFDEIAPSARGTALSMINAALPLGQPVVLSSRAREYRDTRSPAGGVPVRLSGAAAIRIKPLDVHDVAAYLRRDAGGDHTAAAARWDPVIARLGTGAPVGRVLRTPLMLFLASAVYNPRPGEHVAVLPDPAELCDTRRFSAPAEIREYLFEAYLPAAYRPHPLYPCRWTPDRAERALTRLARHLHDDLDDTTDLGWWQFYRMLPRRMPQVVAGFVLGTGAWLSADVLDRVTAFLAHLDGRWGAGPQAAVVGGLAGGVAGGLGCGLVAGVSAGIAEGLTQALFMGQPGMLLTNGASGSAYGFAGGLVGALSSTLAARQRSRGASPWADWQWDWHGLMVGVVCGGAPWFLFRPVYGSSAALVGASVNAVLYGAAGGMFGSLATVLSSRRTRSAPAVKTLWSWGWRSFRVCVASGPVLACIHWSVLAVQGRLTGIPGYAVVAMLPFACAYGIALGLACGLKSTPADLGGAVGPTTLLAQDVRTFIKLWASVGVTVSAAFVLCYGVGNLAHVSPLYGLTGSPSGLRDPTVTSAHIIATGLAYGITIGLAAALSQTACWYYILSRSYLSLRRQLPRDLSGFFADAHERRGVLRQVGAAYQFSHIDLQHHLAAPTRRGTIPAPHAGVPGPRTRTGTPPGHRGHRH